MKNIEYFWDDETGIATCKLTKDNNIFVGCAICLPEDEDMKSEKTGCQIAYSRAAIKYYIHCRDNIIKPSLRALNDLYYSINQSNNFNENSYENKMLQRKLRQSKIDLIAVNKLIASEKQGLKEFIQNKDIFYKKVRENRAKAAKGKNN